MLEDYDNKAKKRTSRWFYLAVILGVLVVIIASLFTMKYFGLISFSGTGIASLSSNSDAKEFMDHLRNSPQSAEWYRQINSVERHNDSFEIKTFLINKDQFAVAICNASANYIVNRNPSIKISSVSIVSASGKELIMINDSNHDCGQASVISPVYDEKKYLASLPPPVVKVGMDYEVVTKLCGKGHGISSYETASGTSVLITYDDLNSKSGCWGTFTFLDWKLYSIYR